ncbi:MAG: aminoglycoside phosphotransferase family protein [Oligoflexales bacterium]
MEAQAVLKTPEIKQGSSKALPPPPPAAVQAALGFENITIDWLAGDGSDRCYYRIFSKGQPSYVLMQLSETDATQLRNNQYDWVTIATLLNDCGVRVPKTVKVLPEYSALIIEDYGNVMLESLVMEKYQHADWASITKFYEQCFSVISNFLAISKSGNSPWEKRAFDQEKYFWEMKFFKQNFLELELSGTISKKEYDVFLEESLALSQYLAKFSKWFIHRDFHSRNIMIKDEQVAILDFQDARIGSASYDLLSLCFDSYVPFPKNFRLELFELGRASIAKNAGPDVAEEIDAHWKACLLQRQLKAIGSFGYLSNVKLKGDYLKYVRPALETVSAELVADKRWEFISTKLISKIQKAFIKK